MNANKTFCVCWVSTMVVIALSVLAPPLERLSVTLEKYAEVMRMDCKVGDGTPPKSLNDPKRKPFSYRK